MNEPETKIPVSYFAVQPKVFNAVANMLAELPYKQVCNLLKSFADGSRAMFDPLPLPVKMKGPGARVVTDPLDKRDGDAVGEPLVRVGAGKIDPVPDPKLNNETVDKPEKEEL